MLRSRYFKNHKFLIFIPILCILLSASWLNAHAQDQVEYQGLPAVACIDPTKPVLQNFSLTITIMRDFKPFPLESSIGHDPGNCLRVIHINDTSGSVFITTNDRKTYTLDDFFKVWHKNYYYVFPNVHKILVYVNGVVVDTNEQTQLYANERITIVYASF